MALDTLSRQWLAQLTVALATEDQAWLKAASLNRLAQLLDSADATEAAQIDHLIDQLSDRLIADLEEVLNQPKHNF